MSEKYIHSGDVNPEHGGMLFTLNSWGFGYVSLIRWTPCSDAGGPDNQFWIERGSIVTDDDERNARALETIGLSKTGDDWKKLTPYQRKCAIVQALVGYIGVDCDARWTVQIGQKPDVNHSCDWDAFEVDTVLRAGSCIRRYCFKERH